MSYFFFSWTAIVPNLDLHAYFQLVVHITLLLYYYKIIRDSNIKIKAITVSLFISLSVFVGQCSVTCGGRGTMSRAVHCVWVSSKASTSQQHCNVTTRPSATKPCFTLPCQSTSNHPVKGFHDPYIVNFCNLFLFIEFISQHHNTRIIL